MGEISLRVLESEDLPAALELTRMAGWNQTRDDWLGFARIAPSGCLAAILDRRVAGTVVAMPATPAIGWISMVLVHQRCRRLGIGTAMVRAALEHLAEQPAVMLDATVAGAQVYRKLDFETVATITRYRRPAAEAAEPDRRSPGPLSVDEVIRLDSEITGMERAALLRALLDRPGVELLGQADGANAGYAALRPGYQAMQLGPVVARSEGAGSDLLIAAAEGSGGELIVDVPDGLVPAVVLEALGLQRERGFERMSHGSAPDTLHGVVATAGPDWS